MISRGHLFSPVEVLIKELSKNWKYFKYVARHRYFVFIECYKLDIPIQGITHDLSKFLPDEWFPYNEFFYGEGNKQEFDRACLKHYQRNQHHWNYWIFKDAQGSDVIIPMDEKFIREMVADWRGMGRAKGFASCSSWYKSNRDKMRLHPFTRSRLEQILKELGELDSLEFTKVVGE